MQKGTALIISLNFRPAHVSHLVASYRQMNELGYHSVCYVNPKTISFLPPDVKVITDLRDIDEVNIAIFWFPSVRNISAMLKLKYKFKSKIIYVYHEPRETFKTYIKAGNSYSYTCKVFAKYYIGLIFLKLSDLIILPSTKALNLYEKGLGSKICKKYKYLPLMYCDETNSKTNGSVRQYIAYIGGISTDHAFPEFEKFISQAMNNHEFPTTKFLIATRDAINLNNTLKHMVKIGKLVVVSGRPLTNEEINNYYSSSWFIWNAYNRTTQSGVLAKAFMFGTPAIVMKKNLSELICDDTEVVTIDNNNDYSQLKTAAHRLIDNHSKFEKNTRINFERNFLYSTHNNTMHEIINAIN